MQRMKWFERKFDTQQPVGIFPNLLVRLSGTPARLEEMVKALPKEILATRVENPSKTPDAKPIWSVLEQIGHLIVIEELHDGRIDDFKAGLPALRAADLQNKKTWEGDFNSQSADKLLAEFRNVRRHFIGRLDELEDEVISRLSLHPRLQRPMTVVDMAFFVAEHDDLHLTLITEISRQLLGNKQTA
jgi:hypothetical protein